MLDQIPYGSALTSAQFCRWYFVLRLYVSPEVRIPSRFEDVSAAWTRDAVANFLVFEFSPQDRHKREPGARRTPETDVLMLALPGTHYHISYLTENRFFVTRVILELPPRYTDVALHESARSACGAPVSLSLQAPPPFQAEGKL